MTDVEKLIDEMQETKIAHPTLEIPEVLRIFQIRAMNDLTKEIRRFINGR